MGSRRGQCELAATINDEDPWQSFKPPILEEPSAIGVGWHDGVLPGDGPVLFKRARHRGGQVVERHMKEPDVLFPTEQRM